MNCLFLLCSQSWLVASCLYYINMKSIYCQWRLNWKRSIDRSAYLWSSGLVCMAEPRTKLACVSWQLKCVRLQRMQHAVERAEWELLCDRGGGKKRMRIDECVGLRGRDKIYIYLLYGHIYRRVGRKINALRAVGIRRDDEQETPLELWRT